MWTNVQLAATSANPTLNAEIQKAVMNVSVFMDTRIKMACVDVCLLYFHLCHIAIEYCKKILHVRTYNTNILNCNTLHVTVGNWVYLIKG